MLRDLLLAPPYRRHRLAAAYLAYLLIVVIGSIPGARAEIGTLASGYVLHSTAYAGIAFLLCVGYPGSPARRALLAVLTVAVMGALDETVQSFFPYRHADVHDWMVDCAAALVSSALTSLVVPRLRP